MDKVNVDLMNDCEDEFGLPSHLFFLGGYPDAFKTS